MFFVELMSGSRVFVFIGCWRDVNDDYCSDYLFVFLVFGDGVEFRFDGKSRNNDFG